MGQAEVALALKGGDGGHAVLDGEAQLFHASEAFDLQRDAAVAQGLGLGAEGKAGADDLGVV